MPSTGELEPSTRRMLPSTAVLSRSTGELLPSTRVLEPSTGRMLPSTAVLGRSTGELLPSTGVLAPSPRRMLPSTAVLSRSTGELRQVPEYLSQVLEGCCRVPQYSAEVLENFCQVPEYSRQVLEGCRRVPEHSARGSEPWSQDLEGSRRFPGLPRDLKRCVGRRGPKKGAWPMATPRCGGWLKGNYGFAASAGGSVLVRFRFTGWPSGPTRRMRGWLRKGWTPNSTSFSARLP